MRFEMAFFDIFKKKKRIVEEKTDDSIDFLALSKEEQENYIESQYDIIRECNQFINDAKAEYKVVGSYFSDIQLIDTQPEEIREQIRNVAKSIDELSVDRRIYKNEESKVSMSRYRQMARDEKNIVDSIKKLQNNESFQQLVKRDMKLLEGEIAALRIAAEELVERQEMFRKISVASVIAFGLLFLVMIFHGLTTEEEFGIGFLVILLLATIFLTVEVVIYTKTIYEVRLTQKKLHKAIILSNRVKIKYLNATNLVEYQYAKFDVKSSYELSEEYQLYLEAKRQKENYRRATIELSLQEEKLLELLSNPPLFDSKIWLSQVRALYDAKEMVEIRHGYSVRRQILRNQIEESQKKAEDAARTLNDLMVTNPTYKGMILAVKERSSRKEK